MKSIKVILGLKYEWTTKKINCTSLTFNWHFRANRNHLLGLWFVFLIQIIFPSLTSLFLVSCLVSFTYISFKVRESNTFVVKFTSPYLLYLHWLWNVSRLGHFDLYTFCSSTLRTSTDFEITTCPTRLLWYTLFIHNVHTSLCIFHAKFWPSIESFFICKIKIMLLNCTWSSFKGNLYFLTPLPWLYWLQ